MARDEEITITDEDLLPEGTSFEPDEDDDFDINNLRVNFSEKEAQSEARDFDPLPSGKYHVSITEVTVERSQSKKNPGKPYYAFQVTVQEGKYENRKLYGNCMLWAGAGYTLVQIMKAMGKPLNGNVPTPDELEGYHFVVSVANIVDTYKVEKDGWTPSDGPKPRKNEIKSWFKYDSRDVQPKGVGSDSMLP